MKIAKTLPRVLAIFMPILAKTHEYLLRLKLDDIIKSDITIPYGGGPY